ncbi:MAG TPA: peptide ABC transporter substrate-binding protein [Ktedonobacteraceae bacterium]|nr:peptide ABC transporter substrate-binding protein [Ktedonobacteraceae bacterium]
MLHRRLHLSQRKSRGFLVVLMLFLTIILAACAGGGNSSSSGSAGTTTSSGKTPLPAAKQILTFPNVGTTDLTTLDPALGLDQNSAVVARMLYTGLVKTDQNLHILPDQATWQISSDNKVYTFTLKPNITFSDGSPVTAQTYVDSWMRALSPSLASPVALDFERPIVGAVDVSNGKAQTLAGVKALDAHTLQVTLTQPTPYFLSMLTNPFFSPLNSQLIALYGQKDWSWHVAKNPVGTGPLMVKEWLHNVKMILVPNPHYYGNKTRLTEVDMFFINDPLIAFKTYRAGQYDFVWGMAPSDMAAAKGLSGFLSVSLLQTDALFFDTTSPPFDNVAVRQAFAYAIDKQTLAHKVLADSAFAAPTILPPGMPGYQPNDQGLAYDQTKAKSLLSTVYPDVTTFPPVTFSYPTALISLGEARALRNMWQTTLGIPVDLHPIELGAYNQEVSNHQIQFGFTQWSADFPDPYDCLALNLVSTADDNTAQWHSSTFDQAINQAETLTGNARLALYDKAEQTAINDVAWLPLDHQAITAVISSWVHGVTLNGNGLYFGDWSNVYLTQH